ncbi:MAG: NADH-quinone oxidoreductase subunit NuoK [Oligoflexales bacterium]|nr:NADH-quinone oxidoreductase subunit NuoK [Oligoflexales bacterium]
MVPIEHYLVLACIIFAIGLIGAIIRKNIVFILMSIQLMLSAACLIFVAASKHFQSNDGQMLMILITLTAICEIAIGLVIVLSLFRQYKTNNSDFFKILRG